VSYYDYYRPEAYIPHNRRLRGKESSINDEIDRLRHSANQVAADAGVTTHVVAVVSCIFGIGSPDDYQESVLSLQVGRDVKRSEICAAHSMRIERNDMTSSAG